MKKNFGIYYALIAAIVAADQAVKASVDALLAPGDSVPVIEGIFHLTYVRNSGAAFSILQEQRLLLIVLPAVLIGALFFFLKKGYAGDSAVLRTALSLIIAGGAGNLIDRLFRGYVVDLFDFRVWPVFNVADIAVCAGCALMLLYVLLSDRRERKDASLNGSEKDEGK